MVTFSSANGEDVPLLDGQIVYVGEYAPVCNASTEQAGQGTDRYEVYICPEKPAGSVPSEFDCIFEGTRISSARGGLTRSTVQGIMIER